MTAPRKLCTMSRLVASIPNLAYKIGTIVTLDICNYWNFDCSVTYYFTIAPIVGTMTNGFIDIVSYNTADAGTYSVMLELDDGINYDFFNFQIIASYSCLTDVIISYPTPVVTYYEIGDAAKVCYTRAYTINIGPACNPISYGPI